MPSSHWDWTFLRRARFYVRQAVRHLPRLYLPVSRVRRRPYMLIRGRPMVHTGVVGDGTEVVIEGYPRCGNTFAVVAFQLAQGKTVEAAHHLHAEAQIVGAVRAGLPTVLLIRDPEQAVVSNARSFGYPLRTALRDYVVFYRRVLPHHEGFVVADFHDVTTDFGAVIDRVNSRFGTDFESFDHTTEATEQCFEVIDEFYRRTAPEPGRTVARPSSQRQAGKQELRDAFRAPALRALREEAYRLYRTLSPPQGPAAPVRAPQHAATRRETERLEASPPVQP